MDPKTYIVNSRVTSKCVAPYRRMIATFDNEQYHEYVTLGAIPKIFMIRSRHTPKVVPDVVTFFSLMRSAH